MKNKKQITIAICSIVCILLLAVIIFFALGGGRSKTPIEPEQEQIEEQEQQEDEEINEQDKEQENEQNGTASNAQNGSAEQKAEENAVAIEQFFEDFLIVAPAQIAEQGEDKRDEIFAGLFAPYMSMEYYESFVKEWELYPGIFAERGIIFTLESSSFVNTAEGLRVEFTVHGAADGQDEEFTIEATFEIEDGIINGFEMENFRSFQSFLDNF